MPRYAYVILCLGWLGWAFAFFFRKRAGATTRKNKQARWGVLLQIVGFSLLWQGKFWELTLSWTFLLAIALLLTAILLSWTGVTALGRQWRIDAGLNADHQLIRSGPYSVIRHPIYTSMLCLFLGTGLIVAPWPLFFVSLAVFTVGTEIRVRIEDNLLASQFGDEFAVYKRTVPAYLPRLR